MRSLGYERLVLAAVVFTVLFSQVVLYPGIRFTVEALGATTELDASMWFLVAEFAAFVCFAIVWGIISDRFGRRKPFIIVGAFGGALGYFILIAVPTMFRGAFTFEQILIVRAFQGAMTIGAFSLALTMLMDLPGGHGANMGTAGIAIGLGTAIGAPVGGVLSSVGPLAPLAIGGILLVFVLPLVGLVEDRAPQSVHTRLYTIAGRMFRTPSLGIPFAFGYIDRLTAGFFSLVGVFYFQDELGLDPLGTGFMLALFFVPFALLQYPFGVLSDRIGRFIPVVVGSVSYGICIVFIGMVGSIGLTAGGMLLIGILGALVAPATMALVTDIADATERGSAMAGYNIAGSLGFLTGFLLGGIVTGIHGYQIAFTVVGGLEIFIALIAAPIFVRMTLPVEPLYSQK